ncbi:MAG TPA: hypothetical protein VGA20_07085 [Gemmatimonadales bacterium]
MIARSAVCRAAAALVILLSVACGSKRVATPPVLLPPRVDLRPHGRLALMTFTIENAKGSLHTLATQRFSEAVLVAQPGIEILELGPADSLMARAGEREFGPRSAKAVGEQHQVPVVFLGHLKVSEVKPSARLLGASLPRLEAKVTVELTVRLVSTGSGGTLWRGSSGATETVGHVALTGGLPTFSAENPNEAYGRLINYLVEQVTWDFRPTWQRQ